MYIAPNSLIYVYSGCPIAPDYSNTLWFDNEAQQRAYFLPSNTAQNGYKYSFSDCYYVRDGVIKVQKRYENLRDINYLAFRNGLDSPATAKWYYCFVDMVRYVNDDTTEIHYSVDLVQSYLFDATLKECYVERQHSDSDVVGDNLVPEPIGLGQMVFNNYDRVGNDLTNCVIMVLYSDPDDNTASNIGNIYDGVFSAYKMTCFSVDSTGISALATFLAQFLRTPEAILSMYMFPASMVTVSSWSGGEGKGQGIIPPGGTGWSHSYSLNTCGSTLDGYTPVNKKLLTYPYNYLHVDDSNGGNLELRYEKFIESNGSKTGQVRVYASLGQPAQVNLRPENYLKVNSGGLYGANPIHTLSLTISGFPMCSWNYDAWAVWAMQNSFPILVRGIEALASMGLSEMFMSGESGTITKDITHYAERVGTNKGYERLKEGSNTRAIETQRYNDNDLSGYANANRAVGSLADTAINAYSALRAPNIVGGSFNVGNANYSNKFMNFYYGRLSMDYIHAVRADRFLSRYGYAQMRVMYPNRKTRTRFTYLKTRDCFIVGKMPSLLARELEAIYNNGITFWNDKTTIGDYDSSKPIIGVG